MKGKIRALIGIALFSVVHIILGAFFIKAVTDSVKETSSQFNATANQDNESVYQMKIDVQTARLKVESDLKLLGELVDEIKKKIGDFPPDDAYRLSGFWETYRSNQDEPTDPFDGKSYGYYLTEGGYVIWSCGPDGLEKTEDDLLFESGTKNK